MRYSDEQIARFKSFQETPGHTHVFVVERGEESLRRDGPDATLSKDAVEELGTMASSWLFSRAGRAAPYRPRTVDMVLSVALGDEPMPEGETTVRRWRVGDDVDEMQHVDGQTCVVAVELPDTLPRAQLSRMADSAVERVEAATMVWVATRIHRQWNAEATPAHKVTMAVKVLLDGELAEDDEGTVKVALPDGSHRYGPATD